MNTVSALTLLAGMAVAGVLGDLVGVVPVINTQGVVYVLAGLLVLTVARPHRTVTPDVEQAMPVGKPYHEGWKND